MCDGGKGVGPTGYAVYLDFKEALQREGVQGIKKKYGNLFQMYERITGENPYETPMMIYPAIHYTMGGLWVDYNLMSTIPGLFVLGEANFSDHGSNRLGASALMQGLADGYFVVPYTIGGYLAGTRLPEVHESHAAFQESARGATEAATRLLAIKGKRTVADFHRDLGRIMWENCGMAREETGLLKAKESIPALRQEFWKNLNVPGSAADLNQSLERANRVADYLEFAELMIDDALARKESCGCHFNLAYQTDDHEAKRNDETSCYVAAWEFNGVGNPPTLHKEPLVFENVALAQRSYK
jgi:succinate dehydrogenase / fumarate reductase flavoprotein subunit